jgi:Molybdopterin oxidoreductase Fe4S4 domain
MTAPRVVRTMCPMNCHPTFCGMLVEVDDGKLKTVSGDKENPDSSLEMSVILFLHVFSTCKFSTDIWGRAGTRRYASPFSLHQCARRYGGGRHAGP